MSIKTSFVIPSRNCVTWLPHAVQSVFDQTHKDWELILVDDGSTDHTPQYVSWLEAKKDERVLVLRTVGVGRSAARNLGNSKASGDLILVLDADDLATPNRAALTVKKFNDTGAQFIYGSAVVMDALGREIGKEIAGFINKDEAIKTLLNRIVHSTVAYTQDFAEKYKYECGKFSELGIDDWHQQIRAIMDGVKMDLISSTICGYRKLESSISGKRDQLEVKKAKESFLASMLEVA